MKNIYYSITSVPDSPYWASLTLCESECGKYAFVPGEYNAIIQHASKEDAERFVLQLSKPIYYELYKSHYELVYVEPNSILLGQLLYKWDTYTDELVEMLDKIKVAQSWPWYLRLYYGALNYCGSLYDRFRTRP